MPLSGSRPPLSPRPAGRGATLALAPVVALALALTGCSGDDKKPAAGPKPPPASEQPQEQATAAPGSKTFGSTTAGLRKPVTYDDKITVAINDIRYVKNQAKGPGELTGNTLTIFTLRFTNGSGQPLDLNKVKVVAKYGSARTEASPTSYADFNDFHGTVAPGAHRSASYAFDLPPEGYKNVVLGVNFDDKHKTAVFAGSLKQ
ncbi:hypothetical protein [Spirillospora sp. NPDC029432]|uniref:hypothetical protein n=1 Tax=Spirillospora sp. NPDC029432 TaxID=3154599 RepID=UPI003454BFC6